MTRINLYPWRIEVDERHKKQFLLLLSALNIVIVIIMLLVSIIYSSWINIETEDNAYLNKELIAVNSKLRQIEKLKSQKEALISRLSVIQEIEQDRYSTVYLFNEIINLINPLIVLKDIKRKDKLIKISGYAGSNDDVAKFLRSLQFSQRFNNAELNQIKVEQKVNNDAGANVNNISQISGHNNDNSALGLNHFFELQFYQNKSKEEIINSNNSDKNLQGQKPKEEVNNTNSSDKSIKEHKKDA